MFKSDKQLLLKLARDTLTAYFKDTDPDTSECSHLTQIRGCFVTLYKRGEIRGTIGFPKPIMPLYEQVIAATKAAAFDDSRFEPVMQEELKDIKIEITVLGKVELIKAESQKDYIDSIRIGKDGLIIKRGEYSGLLLPQVAAGYHWTPMQFLEATCREAGLPPESWRLTNTQVFKVHAEVFSE